MSIADLPGMAALGRLWPGLRFARASPPIPAAAILIGGAATVAWLIATLRGGAAPGSTASIVFGIGAAVMLLVVMAYAVRRAMPAVRALGRTRTWLQLHVWGGLLFLLLMLLHTGWGVPGGTLVTVLWMLSIWVVASGLAGLWLQRSVPSLLDATSSFEVNLYRIPELVADLRQRAETLAKSSGPAIQAYYARELAPDMEAPRATRRSLLGRSRITSYRSREYQILRRTVAPDATPGLDELFQLHSTKLEMDVHYTLQRVLRVWLALHLPASVVLLGVTAMHIILALYY
jgi:hypothetical protein